MDGQNNNTPGTEMEKPAAPIHTNPSTGRELWSIGKRMENVGLEIGLLLLLFLEVFVFLYVFINTQSSPPEESFSC